MSSSVAKLWSLQSLIKTTESMRSIPNIFFLNNHEQKDVKGRGSKVLWQNVKFCRLKFEHWKINWMQFFYQNFWHAQRRIYELKILEKHKNNTVNEIFLYRVILPIKVLVLLNNRSMAGFLHTTVFN